MKKYILLLAVACTILFVPDVEACGEIKELKTDIGSISIVDDSTYLVTVPEGTSTVTLEGSTDYTWVSGFAPRSVPTSSDAKLMVDGEACGYGIYTYFVKFKTISNLIAEGEIESTIPDESNPDVESNGDETPDTNETNNPTNDVLPLTWLEIIGVDIDFDPSIRVYDLVAESNMTSLDIRAESEDPTVLITISENAKMLEIGTNVIEIMLSDSFGNTGTYILNVLKEEAKSNNNLLSSITIDGYQLNFDTSITNYDLEIGKDKMLTINALPVSDKASVSILGNSNLSNGSIIKISVTAEDGSTRDYIINIIKKFNIMDYWIYIVLVLLILLILLILMSRKKKKNQKKMGPQELQGQENTAGVVQEVAPQNTNTATPETNQGGSEVASSAPVGTLKIIEPTNVETPVEEASAPVQVKSAVDEDNSPTEIFQL